MKTAFPFGLRLCSAGAALLCLSSPNALAAPSSPQMVTSRALPATALPASVRAVMPPGAVSVSLFRMAPAKGEKPFLFHLWTAPRRDPDGGGTFGVRPGTYRGPVKAAEAKAGGLRPSPFMLDIFVPGDKAGQWQYENSVITSDTKAPTGYTLQYLEAKQKQGYVITTYDSFFRGFSYTLHTFETGWESTPLSRRFDGYVYVLLTRYTFPRDSNGVLQVMRDEQDTKAQTRRTPFAWTREGWVMGKPVKRVATE